MEFKMANGLLIQILTYGILFLSIPFFLVLFKNVLFSLGFRKDTPEELDNILKQEYPSYYKHVYPASIFGLIVVCISGIIIGIIFGVEWLNRIQRTLFTSSETLLFFGIRGGSPHMLLLPQLLFVICYPMLFFGLILEKIFPKINEYSQYDYMKRRQSHPFLGVNLSSWDLTKLWTILVLLFLPLTYLALNDYINVGEDTIIVKHVTLMSEEYNWNEVKAVTLSYKIKEDDYGKLSFIPVSTMNLVNGNSINLWDQTGSNEPESNEVIRTLQYAKNRGIHIDVKQLDNQALSALSNYRDDIEKELITLYEKASNIN